MAEVVRYPPRATVQRLLPPEQWRKKQIGNLKAVGEGNYRVGVAFPARDPIDAGIRAEPRFAEVMKKAIDEQRRAKALMAVTIDEWYGYTQEIGAGRLVEGVVKREGEVAEFVNAWQPTLTEHVGKIDVMPEITDREREEKMLANLRGLKALKGVWRKPVRS